MYNPNFVPMRSPYGASNEFADPPRPANRELGRYELEHIATFNNISRRMRIPEDVLVQLRQLEATGQLLSMRIVLSIMPNALVVVYAQTGETIEQFPMRCVMNPTAYNGRPNLLMFTCTEGDSSEVHVFASAIYSVNEIVDRINIAKADTQHSSRDRFDEESLYGASAMSTYGLGDFFGPPKPGPNAPPAYARRYSTLLHNRAMNAGYSEQAQQFRLMRDLQWRNEANMNGTPASYQPYGGAPSSRATGSGFETHMQVLNWCFDDIEKFVNQLYRAVQAFRELDRRVSARKHRNYMPGDGMLVRQARLPTDSELFDILQKFKFTLNLLGRVQHVLTKPNAPDVIQKLIPFLRTVVDASEIPGQQSLVPSVVSPLMTAEVVTLLKHCLVSDDMQFWRSLGDAWFVPSEEWIGGPAEAYSPRFTNGYKLSAQEADELIRGSVPSNVSSHHNGVSGGLSNGASNGMGPVRLGALANQAAEEAQRRRDEVDYGMENSYSPRPRNAAPNNAPAASNPNARALEKLEEVNQRYAAELRARGARAYEVTNEYTPKNAKEMSVMRGEVVEVLSDDRQWWKVRSVTGQVGYCPCTILQPLDPLPPRDYDETGAARALNRSSLLPNSTAAQAQLAAQRASAPTPAAPPAANGESRRLPQAYPNAQYGSQSKPAAADGYSREKRSQNAARPRKTMDEPEYPYYSEAAYSQEVYLPPVLRGVSGGQAPLPLTVRPKSVQQYVLLPDSPPEEVEAWLRSKNFRPMTVTALAGLNGEQLFNLKKLYPELLARCNREDIKRLEDNIQLQKNISGYLTVSKRQLNDVLGKRKIMAEEIEEGVESVADEMD